MVGFYGDYAIEMLPIEGRTAIVTGATGALRGAIAAAYTVCRVKMVLTGRNKEKLEVLAGEIRNAGREALPYTAGSSMEEQAEGLVAFTAKQYGGLGILAVFHGYNKPQNILGQSVEDWQYIMDANLESVYVVVKYAGEQTAYQGRGDKMVVVSSARSKMGTAGYTSYCASKGAYDLMIQSLACDLSAKYNINVNTINLAALRPGLTGRMFDTESEVYRSSPRCLLIGRLGEPSDSVGITVFLAMPASDFPIGENHNTTGGYWTCQNCGVEQNQEEGELNMGSIRNILICGVGVIGKSIAFVFSANPEYRITLYNIFPTDVEKGIRTNTRQLVERETLTGGTLTKRLSRISFISDLGSWEVRTANLIIEIVFEDMKVKQNTLEALEERLNSDAIFCANSSVMSPSGVSSRLGHRGRFAGTYFWNPARLIPLVEVVISDAASDDMARTMMEVLTPVEKRPVLCEKDVPGFIASRMQHALWREAISTVGRGITDAGTIDEAVHYSFDLRLPQLDPMENMNVVGVNLVFNIHDYVLADLEGSHQSSAMLRQLKEDGKLGFKTGEGFQARSEEQKIESAANLNQYLIRMIYGK